MEKNKIFILIPFLLFLSACVNRMDIPQESIYILWKSPVMKYADQGFIYREKNKISLEIYASGQPAVSLDITPSQVCTNGLCMSKSEFNRRYLNAQYPSNTIDSILSFSPIFGAKGLKRDKEGFYQLIQKRGVYDINYTVSNDSLSFNDTISDITIKIHKNR